MTAAQIRPGNRHRDRHSPSGQNARL